MGGWRGHGLAFAVAWAALAPTALVGAQPPLVISDEIDPVIDGRTARTDVPRMFPDGPGVAIQDVGTIDTSLRIGSTRPSFLDACLPGAIGLSTCMRDDGPAGSPALRRMLLADGTVLDTTPMMGVFARGYGPSMLAAHGDDYLVVRSSGQIHLWRAGDPPEVTTSVPMSCPLCLVNAVACAARGCAAVIASGWTGGQAWLFRVEVGDTPALGARTELGDGGYDVPTLVALDDEWVVAALGAYAFFDDALAPLGSVSIGGGVGFVRDAVIAIDAAGSVSRCRAGACATLGTVPPALRPARPYAAQLTCGSEVCGVVATNPGGTHVGCVSGADGTSVDLTDAYWSRPADQSSPQVVVTSSGALVAYTDQRDARTRAAIAPLDGMTRLPVFADFDRAVTSVPRTFLPTRHGAAIERLDESDAFGATQLSWVRIDRAGALVDSRLDPSACFGILVSGPNGPARVCGSLTASVWATGATMLVRLDDDGMPRGEPLALPTLALPTAVAAGERRTLVLDVADRAVLVDESTDAITPVPLAAERASRAVAAGAERFAIVSWVPSTAGFGVTMIDDVGRVTSVPGGSDGGVVDGLDVTYDGATFLVVWSEIDPTGTSRRVLLRRLRADGALEPTAHLLTDAGALDGAGFDVPRVASGGAGRSAVVFTRATRTSEGTQVLDVRAFDVHAAGPNGMGCANDDECGSGLCVSGVCCSTPCTGPCMACRVADGARTNGVCVDTCAAPSAVHDAGVDGGPGDAGVRRDAGEGNEPGLHPLPRCGCRAAGTGRGVPALWVLALAALVARARRGIDRR